MYFICATCFDLTLGRHHQELKIVQNIREYIKITLSEFRSQIHSVFVMLHYRGFIKTAVKSVKGKAVPLQAWSGPQGSRKLRFPDFVKTAQDGGKVVSLTHRPPLPPRNTPGTHFC
jgi:hypothetical protein